MTDTPTSATIYRSDGYRTVVCPACKGAKSVPSKGWPNVRVHCATCDGHGQALIEEER